MDLSVRAHGLTPDPDADLFSGFPSRVWRDSARPGDECHIRNDVRTVLPLEIPG